MYIQEKDKVRFAVLGFGHIGKRHAEMIRRNPEAELVAACDIMKPPDDVIAETKAPFFTGIDELLEKAGAFDVLNVCTPNGLHGEHSLKGLEARKHIVVEKPMALTVADCERVIHKSLSVNRQVFCVMQNRYSPPSAWIKDLVDKNILGKIFLVQVNCFWNRDERYYTGKNWKGSADLDGGTLFTQFSHFIDIMYWLFGDIRNIQGQFKDFSHHTTTAFEDSGSITFEFNRGGIGSLTYSTAVWDKNFESSLTIVGEKGTVKIGGQYMNKVEYCHIAGYSLPELPEASPANNYGAFTGSAANHHFIIQNVIDTLKGRTAATTNVLEGLKVVDIIERIYALRKLNKLEQQKISLS